MIYSAGYFCEKVGANFLHFRSQNAPILIVIATPLDSYDEIDIQNYAHVSALV